MGQENEEWDLGKGKGERGKEKGVMSKGYGKGNGKGGKGKKDG